MIQKAQDCELDVICKLVNDAYSTGVQFKKLPRFHSKAYAEKHLENMWTYREEPQGEIIACVFIKLESDHVFIGPLAVKKEYQARGIGSKLMDFAEGFHEVRRLSVISVKENIIQIYKRRGYSEIFREPIRNVLPEEMLNILDAELITLERKK